MKKGILFFLFAALLTPLSLCANFIPIAPTTCNLPAPENLHVVSYGSNSVQVAWNPVQGADTYRVTTKDATTDAILSDFSIDQPDATISGLPDDVPLKVTIKGVDPNGCVGVGSYIDIGPLSLVFDLVLHPNDGNVPEVDCLTECTVSAVEPGQPSVPQFTCQLELVQGGGSYFPFWLEIHPPVIRGDMIPPSFRNLYLYVYPIIEVQNGKTYRYTHVEQHFRTTTAQWALSKAPNNPGLVQISTSPEAQAAICNFEVNVWGGNIQIFLAAGYTAIKKDDCPNISWITGGDGLAAQQTTPSIYETMTPSGNPSESNFNLATTGKSSPTFRVVNPVKNELVLNFEQPTGQAAILELYSMNGTLAARQQLPEGVSTFNMPAKDLVPGTYVLRVHQETGVETRLVIKQ